MPEGSTGLGSGRTQVTVNWALSWMTEPLRGLSGLAPPPCCAHLGARTAAGFLMPRQERHAGEGLGAHGAPVLLGTNVSLQVSPQVGAVSEGPAAVRTGIGLLTCMGADVTLEQPGSGEGLAAHLTDAGQRVGADMHLEGTQAGILLVTVPAGEGAPSRQVTVQLLVPGQASQRMIRPVAVDALKATWDSRCPLSPEMFI